MNTKYDYLRKYMLVGDWQTPLTTTTVSIYIFIGGWHVWKRKAGLEHKFEGMEYTLKVSPTVDVQTREEMLARSVEELWEKYRGKMVRLQPLSIAPTLEVPKEFEGKLHFFFDKDAK